MPNDGGHLLLTNEEKEEFLEKEPQAKSFIHPLISAKEFLNNQKRWCLWLLDAEPSKINQSTEVKKRVRLVKEKREKSTREATKKLAATPGFFGEIRQPQNSYILVPRHSSERRKYIPLGFLSPEYIVSDSCLAIDNARLYHFGLLTSLMHMAWVKTVCGRLESRYRYSNEIVYNNYPWPKAPSDKQVAAVEAAAQGVLDARAKYPDSSLADLYDPLTMPPDLVKAHNALDKAVDKCYRGAAFTSETQRLEYLFGLYSEYTKPLIKPEIKGRKKT